MRCVTSCMCAHASGGRFGAEASRTGVQVNKFKARYAGLDALGDVATLSDVAKQDADGKSS